MKKRIESEAKWSDPVVVQIGKRPPEQITNAAEALIFLTTRWPAERGRQYQTATAVCSAALRRQAHSIDARQTFLSAALEARMIV
jgi:hypothetical protein